jgi:hypothetical protein
MPLYRTFQCVLKYAKWRVSYKPKTVRKHRAYNPMLRAYNPNLCIRVEYWYRDTGMDTGMARLTRYTGISGIASMLTSIGILASILVSLVNTG